MPNRRPTSCDAIHASAPASACDEDLRHRVVDALGTVLDPELGISIVDLGLIYGVDVEDGDVLVRLGMTTPACPLGEQIVVDAEACLRSTDGVQDVRVELVWEPLWSPERMSADARRELGWAS
jgi:metal-sulfur cluster biosynthetic enzyme